MKTSKPKQDKYERAIAYLKRYPHKIGEAWTETQHSSPAVQQAHCLFQCLSKNGQWSEDGPCLTQIRCGCSAPAHADLCTLIRNDQRLPVNPYKITPQDLPVFAAWQRLLDKVLKRK